MKAITILSHETDAMFRGDDPRPVKFQKVLDHLNDTDWVSDVLYQFSATERERAANYLKVFYTRRRDYESALANVTITEEEGNEEEGNEEEENYFDIISENWA